MGYVSKNVHKQASVLLCDILEGREMSTVKLFIVNSNTDSYKTVNYILYMLNCSFTEDQRIT